ncbi:MAG: oxygenase MpaB family protein [Verrucomicrobiota bacterium]
MERDEFLFRPDSEMWRVNRERCGLIYGPAAAILQIAHPRIAQGVYDHSDFRGDTLGRLQRTLRGTNGIAFGRISEAEAMKARLSAVHGEVRGEVLEGVEGRRGYSAFEPELLVWVLATLVIAALRGYELIYGEVSLDRKERFYRDMCRFGTYFGVNEADCPEGWGKFETYYEEMIEGDLLGGHAICAELAEVIVHPRDTMGTRLLGRGIDFMAIELLPDRVRERLGLRSTAWTRARMRVARLVLRRAWIHVPRRWRFYPEYLRATSRST